MAEKLEVKADAKTQEEEQASLDETQEREQEILKAIHDKYKDNFTVKQKLLALFYYSQLENANSEKMNKEADTVTSKYQKLYAPLINKLSDIANGKKLEDQDIQNYEQYLAEGDADKKNEILAQDPKPIEEYWLKVFKANALLKEEIHPHDEEPLKALRRVEYIPSENPDKPHDFTLKFEFAPNDFFENDVVIKEFQMIDEREAEKTECTPIKWKEGKDVTKKEVKKNQKNKKTGQTRTTTKLVDRESFFTFFRNMEQKDEDEMDDDDDDDEEEVDDINRHADIGQTIVEEVLPYSPEYYLGVKKDPEVFLGDPRGMADDNEGRGFKARSKMRQLSKQRKSSVYKGPNQMMSVH